MFKHLFESENLQNRYKQYMVVQEDQLYTKLVESLDVILKETYETFDLLENMLVVSFADKTILNEQSNKQIEQIQSFLDNPIKDMTPYSAQRIATIKKTKWHDEKGILGKISSFVKGVARWLWSLVKVVLDGVKKVIVRAFGGSIDIDKTKENIEKMKNAFTRIERYNRDVMEFKPTKPNEKFSVMANVNIPNDVILEAYIPGDDAKISYNDDDNQTTGGRNNNQGNNNQGNRNQGNRNQGNRNQGNRNQGNRNQGNRDQSNRNDNVKPKTSIVTVDLKGEMYSMRVLTDHFLDMYDNTYGSDHENLFGASDLEVIMNVLYDSLNDLKRGKVKAFDMATGYAEIRPIEAGKVREKVIQTNTNLENMKKIFAQTHTGIKQVAKLLNAKQLQALNVSPHIYKFLSMETYNGIMDIINIIEPRIEDALANQKELEQAKKQFSAIAMELEKLSPAITALGTITYVPEQQNRIINLLQSTKYLTQLVQLRLGALTLYIRYLEEINSILSALSVGGQQFIKEFKLKY